MRPHSKAQLAVQYLWEKSSEHTFALFGDY
jgi:hypothetical protein